MRFLGLILAAGWRGLRSADSDQLGFVAAGRFAPGGPFRLTMERSDLSVDSLLAERGADYPNRGTPFWRIVRQYQIRQVGGAGDRWVWVQWPPDSAMVEGGCTVRMGLFRLGQVPTMLSSLDAGCGP